MVKIVELIYCDEARTGKGIEGDPVRRIEQWFEKDGTLVFQKDDWKDEDDLKSKDNYDR